MHVQVGQEHTMKLKHDCSVLSLTEIQQSDQIRIILAASIFRGEVLHIVNAGTEGIPSWEILLETKGGLLHWRQREHGGRVEQLKIRPQSKKPPHRARTRFRSAPNESNERIA